MASNLTEKRWWHFFQIILKAFDVKSEHCNFSEKILEALKPV